MLKTWTRSPGSPKRKAINFSHPNSRYWWWWYHECVFTCTGDGVRTPLPAADTEGHLIKVKPNIQVLLIHVSNHRLTSGHRALELVAEVLHQSCSLKPFNAIQSIWKLASLVYIYILTTILFKFGVKQTCAFRKNKYLLRINEQKLDKVRTEPQ